MKHQDWADNLFPTEDGGHPSRAKKSTLGEQDAPPSPNELAPDLAAFVEKCAKAQGITEVTEADAALRGEAAVDRRRD